MNDFAVDCKDAGQLIRTVANVGREMLPSLSIAGILVMMADMHTDHARKTAVDGNDRITNKKANILTFQRYICYHFIINMEDGSAIEIAISSYYTPDGRNIHGIGIEQDISCVSDGVLYYDTENPIDNPLEKAKEVLPGMLK